MKEIMAIIRLDRINQTKKALVDAGFPSLTCRKVYGRGKANVDYELLRGALVDNNTQSTVPKENVRMLAVQLSENHTLMPKRLITLIVKDEEEQAALDAVLSANSKGCAGDGKLFVFDVARTIRIRSGEENDAAL